MYRNGSLIIFAISKYIENRRYLLQKLSGINNQFLILSYLNIGTVLYLFKRHVPVFETAFLCSYGLFPYSILSHVITLTVLGLPVHLASVLGNLLLVCRDTAVMVLTENIATETSSVNKYVGIVIAAQPLVVYRKVLLKHLRKT